MKCAKDFREIARNALRGHWPSAILAGIIAAILGGDIMYGGASGSSGSASGSGTQAPVNVDLTNFDISLHGGLANVEAAVTDAVPALTGLFVIVAVLIAILAVISIVVGGAVSLGYAKYNLNLVDGKQANAEDLISQFGRLGDGFVMRLLTTIYTVLWAMLLVVPGIIAAFSYSMAPYILYENPGMSATEAIKASKELMRGNKWRLFCLSLSFIGWSILAALTLGIGSIFLRPYVEAAGAAFYRDISSKNEPVYGEYTV